MEMFLVGVLLNSAQPILLTQLPPSDVKLPNAGDEPFKRISTWVEFRVPGKKRHYWKTEMLKS